MTAEIHDACVIATVHINAPPEIVFPYFTDPALIVTWIGERAELDPQPGGIFLLDMGEVIARGAYLTIDPPHRVIFSWGVVGSEALPPGESTVEVVLTADGDETRVELVHRGLPSTQIEVHQAGWEQRLGGLRNAWPQREIQFHLRR